MYFLPVYMYVHTREHNTVPFIHILTIDQPKRQIWRRTQLRKSKDFDIRRRIYFVNILVVIIRKQVTFARTQLRQCFCESYFDIFDMGQVHKKKP